MPKPTIVLVHGAWADGASWNAVSTELQGQGFTVLTPPNLLHGVAGDAAYVASFLTQRTTGPVVLVGHSYGGVVITNAGTAGGDVRALVYVDAFIPEVGETTFQILGGSGSAFDVPDPNAVFDIVGYPGAPEGDAEAFLKPSTVHESFAQDLPEADRWLIVASQRPITLGANTAPTQTTAWKTIPSWTVIGTEDRVIPPATQRSMAERAGSVRTPWMRDFMAFQLVGRIRTVMLVVPACPGSGFLDVPHGRGPPVDQQHGAAGSGHLSIR